MPKVSITKKQLSAMHHLIGQFLELAEECDGEMIINEMGDTVGVDMEEYAALQVLNALRTMHNGRTDNEKVNHE